jgi:hypothetical protein
MAASVAVGVSMLRTGSAQEAGNKYKAANIRSAVNGTRDTLARVENLRLSNAVWISKSVGEWGVPLPRRSRGQT